MIILYRYMSALWLNAIHLLKWLYYLPRYIRTFFSLKNSQKDKDFPIALNYPYLHDVYDTSGTASWHYFHQDLLVAQKIFQSNPTKHVDIGSRVDWFVKIFHIWK